MTAEKRKQIETFRKVARDLECDEDKEQFEKRLGKIARYKPPPPKSKKPKTAKPGQ